MSDQEREAGVAYEVAPGEWATPIVAPPGQRQPLAEVAPIFGRRVVYCGPAGYEYDIWTFSEPVMGRDIDPPLTGMAAAKNFVAIVTWGVWSAWRFAGHEVQDHEVRMVPLYACWLDPLQSTEG